MAVERLFDLEDRRRRQRLIFDKVPYFQTFGMVRSAARWWASACVLRLRRGTCGSFSWVWLPRTETRRVTQHAVATPGQVLVHEIGRPLWGPRTLYLCPAGNPRRQDSLRQALSATPHMSGSLTVRATPPASLVPDFAPRVNRRGGECGARAKLSPATREPALQADWRGRSGLLPSAGQGVRRDPAVAHLFLSGSRSSHPHRPAENGFSIESRPTVDTPQ